MDHVITTADSAPGSGPGLSDPVGTTIPVHHDDHDVFTSSLEEPLDAAERAGARERVTALARGDRVLLGPQPQEGPGARMIEPLGLTDDRTGRDVARATEPGPR